MPRQLPLSGSSQFYAIDSCALIDLEEREDANLLWPLLRPLIVERRVQTVPMVMTELQNVRPAVVRRLKSVRAQLVYNNVAQLTRLAGIYSDRYRHMSRPNHVYTEADPWLLAFAKEEDRIVVTNEKPKRNRHMPDVCKKEGIDCKTLDEFLLMENLVP
jgi:hypothetical protein